jgi:hypothetical protein
MRGLDRIRVRFRWPVARLATPNVILTRKSQIRVTSLSVFCGDFFMAGLTALRSRKSSGGRGKFRCLYGYGRALGAFR